jgi:hypothetical protein
MVAFQDFSNQTLRKASRETKYLIEPTILNLFCKKKGDFEIVVSFQWLMVEVVLSILKVKFLSKTVFEKVLIKTMEIPFSAKSQAF